VLVLEHFVAVAGAVLGFWNRGTSGGPLFQRGVTYITPCTFGAHFRVTTHLENLEKSGNSKVVREKSGKMEKVRGSEIRCFFFKL